MLEKLIKKYDTGFFVDLGSSEERTETTVLTNAGWKGIHIDARLNYAVYSYDGYVDFYDLGEVHPHLKYWSGVKEHLYLKEASKVLPNIDIFASPYLRTKKVECKTLETILNENNIKDITLLKMDIEGCEQEVLSVFPFEKFNIDYVYVETNSCNKILKANGYKPVGMKIRKYQKDVLYKHKDL